MTKQKTGFRLGGRNDTKIVLFLHIVFASIVFLNGTGVEMLDKFITLKGIQSSISRVSSTEKGATTAAPTAVTGPALEVGGTESGVIRTYVWQGAIHAWKSTTKTILIGTGVETFAFAFYQFRPAGHNLTSEWDFLYNKAHNEYLNYLATTGLFGLGSYLSFIGVFIFWFIKKVHGSWLMVHKKNDNNSTTNYELQTMNYALFAGWISILVTNFFGFSVVIVQVFLFLFPAMIFVFIRSNEVTNTRSFALKFPPWTQWFVSAIGLFMIFTIGKFWHADTLFASGYHASRSGNAGQAVQLITQASSRNANEPLYHDELSGNYATLAVSAFENKNATQASQLAGQALSESARALSLSPNNVNFWKTRTKVYYTLSALDPALNAQAIESLNSALKLSPNDPKIYYNLAILLGREGDAEAAITNLLKAKALKANYRDVYYALSVFYTELKKPGDARGILKEYLDTVDPKDQQFLKLLK